MLGDALCQSSIGKWRSSGQNEVQRAAQAINIRLVINLVAINGLLWRQVIRRSQYVFIVLDSQRRLSVFVEWKTF